MLIIGRVLTFYFRQFDWGIFLIRGIQQNSEKQSIQIYYRYSGCYNGRYYFVCTYLFNFLIDKYIAWYSKANTLRELQRYDEAIAVYNKSLEINSEFHWVWYRKATCYLRKYDNSKALENLSKAIELNSEKMHQNAKMDKYWEVVRDSEEFKKLIEEYI